jgi:hypothetical protein
MNHFLKPAICILILFTFLSGCSNRNAIKIPDISGELMQWHNIILTFNGPVSSELDSINPFLDYQMSVTFFKQDKRIIIPGYYAADGNAAETSAEAGNKWQVIFCPDDYGLWNYEVSFLKGKNIAVDRNPEEGEELAFHGATGEILISPSDKTGDDFRSKGRISYVNDHYLRYMGTQEIFLKAGADSPENFLAYFEFDGTYYGGDGERRINEAMPNQTLHRYTPHVKDWKEGDPVWKDGKKGKGIIGALNYLHSKGVNSVYMLTNNVNGDGQDVFPWIKYYSDFTRFDVSKLAQWEIVFTHMDKLGMMCHFVIQETENELMLDSGNVGLKRKLYFRELIARFSHHLGVTWNLGEENGVAPWIGIGQNDRQRKDMSKYIKETDPYDNFLVVHTLPNVDLRDDILTKLLGFPFLDGPSLQTEVNSVHSETLKWRTLSEQQGKKWVVCSDEIGHHSTGAVPDAIDPEHDEIRHKVLWGNLMAGGGGVEWYFGHKYDNDDLNCEDFRSRDRLWELTSLATNFFLDNLPMDKMNPADGLVSPRANYCLAMDDDLLAIYIPSGGASSVRLNPQKSYELKWFDPRNGGDLFNAKEKPEVVSGVSELNFKIGTKEEYDLNEDWVAVLKSIQEQEMSQ